MLRTLSQLPVLIMRSSLISIFDLVVMKLPEEALALKRVSAFLECHQKDKGVKRIIYE
jgi:hypothetical protein